MRKALFLLCSVLWIIGYAEDHQLDIGPEETAAPLGGRTSIAIDSKGQPHIIVDDGVCCDGENWIVAHKINGQWTRTNIPASRVGNPARLYVPHMVIDGSDRAWISGFICDPCGGLILLDSVSTSPVWRWYTTFSAGDGSGNAEVDATRPGHCVFYSRDKYYIYDTNKKIVTQGALAVGGVKAQTFRIHPSGVWHASSNHTGYYASQKLTNKILWIDLPSYGQAGSELNYSGLGIDLENPKGAYFAVQGTAGIFVNIFDGEKMLYSPKSLLKIADPGVGYGNGIIRWGPKLTPAKGGGAFVVWTAEGSKVMLRYISSKGELGTPREIGSGQNASATIDNAGNLHVAYGRGGLRYRKILVDNSSAVERSGRRAGHGGSHILRHSGGQAFDIRGRLTVARPGTGLAVVRYNNSWRIVPPVSGARN